MPKFLFRLAPSSSLTDFHFIVRLGRCAQHPTRDLQRGFIKIGFF
jgi:hypothetical protein